MHMLGAHVFIHQVTRSLLTIALALAVIATKAHALDLLSAYQLALQHDAQLRAAHAKANAQRERLPQAQAQLRPSLALGAVYARNDLSRTQPNMLGRSVTTDDLYNSHNATLTLRWGLYRPAARAGVQAAQAIVDDADAIEQAETGNLALRVATAYFEALLARDQLELTRQAVKVAEVQLDAARKAFAAGTGTRTDIDDVRAQLDLWQAEVLNAHLQWDVARRQLSVLTGQDVVDLPIFEPAHDPVAMPQPLESEAWIERALAHNPELQAYRARITVAQAELKRARSQHLPTLDAVTQVVRSASENTTTPYLRYTNRSVGLQFNLPLYAGGAIESAVRQALAELERAQALLQAAERDLSVRVHREYRGAVEGAQRVQALKVALESAEQALRANQRSREAGVRSLLDVLEAQRRRDQAARNLAQSRYEHLMARLRLTVLVGGDIESELSRSAAAWRSKS